MANKIDPNISNPAFNPNYPNQPGQGNPSYPNQPVSQADLVTRARNIGLLDNASEAEILSAERGRGINNPVSGFRNDPISASRYDFKVSTLKREEVKAHNEKVAQELAEYNNANNPATMASYIEFGEAVEQLNKEVSMTLPLTPLAAATKRVNEAFRAFKS